MAEKLMEFAMTQGPWAIIAIAAALAVWRFAAWSKPHVESGISYLLDIAKAHLELIGWLQTTGNRFAEQQDELVSQQKTQTTLMSETGSHIRKITETLQTHSKTLTDHGEKLGRLLKESVHE